MLSVVAICIGACAGALLRWSLALWLNPVTALPLGTLAVNLVGGYLIGVAVAVFQAMPQLDPAWRLLCITGFLGTLTTFSSFSYEVVAMLQQARYGLALGTVAVHLFGSLTLTIVGIRSTQMLLSHIG